MSFAGVRNSHHFGVAAYHLEPVGAAGMTVHAEATKHLHRTLQQIKATGIATIIVDKNYAAVTAIAQRSMSA